MFKGDIPTKVLILAIVVFIGAVATILTLNAQGTNFETQLRVFLNYGVPSLLALFTLSKVEKSAEKIRTIEKNTNGNLSKLIEKVGPVDSTPPGVYERLEKENNEGR